MLIAPSRKRDTRTLTFRAQWARISIFFLLWCIHHSLDNVTLFFLPDKMLHDAAIIIGGLFVMIIFLNVRVFIIILNIIKYYNIFFIIKIINIIFLNIYTILYNRVFIIRRRRFRSLCMSASTISFGSRLIRACSRELYILITASILASRGRRGRRQVLLLVNPLWSTQLAVDLFQPVIYEDNRH